MAPLGVVGEEITVLVDGLLHDLGDFDDAWHVQMLRDPTAPEQIDAKTGRFYLF